MLNFIRKDSSARELVKQTWNSQTTKFFFFYGQRLLGILMFFLSTYMPLYFCNTFHKELNWMVKNYLKTFVLLLKVCIDQPALCYYCYFSLIYTLNHPFFEKYKINTNPWPWISDPEEYKVRRWETIKNVCLVCIFVNNISFFLVMAANLVSMSYDFDEQPSYPKLLAQQMFCFCIDEFYFYWAHRLLHHPKLYWIHKQHHTASNTIAIDSMNISLQENFLLHTSAVLGGTLLLGSSGHVVTFYVVLLWQFISNIDDHAGYEFPWMSNALPWSTSNTWHNYHHQYNIGNFSAHTIFWDCIFGTCKDFSDHFDRMESKKTDKDRPTQICAHTH